MKKALICLVAPLVTLVTFPVWGWGAGHDEIASLCSRGMPSEIKVFLGSWNGKLDLWCHYPDMTNPGWGARRFMVYEDLVRDVGKDAADEFAKWGFTNGDWLHRHVGRAVSIYMLKEAFRTNRPQLAAFCISELSHAVADQGAINHTPILQFTSYSKFKGVDYGWKNACEFTMRSAEVARVVNAGLTAYRPKSFGTNFAEALNSMVMDCYDQSEIAAEIEIAAAFGSKSEHSAAMAKIAGAQIVSILNMAYTAWIFRDEPFVLTKDVLAGLSSVEEVRRRRTNPATQAVYHGLFDESLNPPSPKATVGLVLEPYGSFHVRSLSYVGKMLSAAYARTLRDKGYSIRAIPYWGLETEDLPSPKDLQAVVVFAGPCSGLTGKIAANLKRYRMSGGCLIWIAGDDPQNVTDFRPFLKRRADEEVPVSSKWAIQNEGVWSRMTVSFAPGFGSLANGAHAFVRNPNFDGFCKPVCLWQVKEGEDVEPLVWLDNGKERFCVGARRGKTFWLPEYLFLPFLFSSDKTVDWQDMRLDSFAEKVGISIVEQCRF